VTAKAVAARTARMDWLIIWTLVLASFWAF
jgi:hypothetical protein